MFDRFMLVAGPCVLETDALNLEIARALASWSREHDVPVVFKASFDKANRARRDSPRGPGIARGLDALARVREQTGLRVLTDIHEPKQAAEAARIADALQIPAFLCRQTDLLEAAGATGRAVNVKKGQWLHPEGMRGAVDKVRGGKPDTEIAVTERGTFFGYGDLVVDMRSFARMRIATGCPVIFDATHSVQRPGLGEGGSSGGAREFIEPLAMAAVAAGADGVFIETHPAPDSAPSDGPNMLPLSEMERLLDRLVSVWETARR